MEGLLSTRPTPSSLITGLFRGQPRLQRGCQLLDINIFYNCHLNLALTNSCIFVWLSQSGQFCQIHHFFRLSDTGCKFECWSFGLCCIVYTCITVICILYYWLYCLHLPNIGVRLGGDWGLMVCTVHTGYCTLITVYCIVCTAYCTLCVVYCILFNVNCIICTIHFILFSFFYVQSILYTCRIYSNWHELYIRACCVAVLCALHQ